MTFLHPSIFLAGLVCIAIPIVIHLLMRRRRRPVPWAAMKFLLEAYRKQKRRLTLEQLLLLALRCLLIGLVGIGLARPMIGAAAGLTGPGPRTVYLVIDNSLVSGVRDAAGTTALERQQARAERVLEQLDSARGDRAGLIVLGGPAEAIVAPPAVDLAGVKSAVRAIEGTDGPADWMGASAVLRSTAAARRGDEPAASVIVLSELRAGSVDLRRPAPKLGLEGGGAVLVSRPAGEAVDNVSVLDVEPLRGVLLKGAEGSGGAGEPARVTVRRSGPGVSKAGVSEVRVSVEGAGGEGGKAGTGLVRWASGQEEANVSVAVPADAGAFAGSGGGSSGRVLAARIDNDALAGDNIWRRPVRLGEAVEVALISPPVGIAGTIEQFTPTDWYRLALSPDGDGSRSGGEVRVTVIESSQAGVRSLAGFDAVIVPYPETLDDGAWRAIGQFARSGGAVILNPTPGESVNVWTDAMGRALGLGWELARESRELAEPATIQPGREGAEAGAGGLLGLLGGELEELLKPVRVRRLLDVDLKDVSARVELRTGDGKPLLVVGEPAGGRGVVAMLLAAPDLAWTDLPVRPLMVPLVQELVRQGAGRAGGAWHGPAGSKAPVPAGAIELRGGSGGSGGSLVMAAAGGESAEAIRRAGVWRALDSTGAEVGLIAVNADPEAAHVEVQTESELAPWLTALAGDSGWGWLDDDSLEVKPGMAAAAGGPGLGAGRAENGMPLSLPVLLGAVVVALAELAVARWSSHARGMRQEGPA
ncbi:MAG: BatA and WFA domain-containing protein [Phycisphaerales bacterium]|nr:BatA and WFA domain-containing protein [Phycisphaerales bacterium]